MTSVRRILVNEGWINDHVESVGGIMWNKHKVYDGVEGGESGEWCIGGKPWLLKDEARLENADEMKRDFESEVRLKDISNGGPHKQRGRG